MGEENNVSAEVDPEDVFEFYDERSAILEFDARLPRFVAEQQAVEEAAAKFGVSEDWVSQVIEGLE